MGKLDTDETLVLLDRAPTQRDQDLIRRVALALERGDERARLLRQTIRRFARYSSYRNIETGPRGRK